MFRNDYKECNESIKPDAKLIEKIINADRSKTKVVYVRKKRNLIQRAGTYAAVLLIIFSTLFLVYNNALNKEYITKVKEYKDIYTLMQAMEKKTEINLLKDDVINFFVPKRTDMQYGEIVIDGSLSNSAANFSDTNIQVAGVQEADIVKTDGKYIYASSEKGVYIIKADGKDLKEVATINPNDMVIRELFITKDRLIVIKTYVIDTETRETVVDIYDITDKEHPKYINTLGQSGLYFSSRMIGDTLYLLSQYNLKHEITKDPSTFIPYLINNKHGNGLMKADDISIAPSPSHYKYLVITGIDTQDPDTHVSSKAIFSSGENIYSSQENLYVATTANKYHNQETKLLKFSLKDGDISVKATGNVPGKILNQFSMDEYNGYFRICTTNQANNLYALDEDLKIVGSLEEIARDERIYSVRFDGDIVYFVTFRQVDPLFTVNLTDPTNPKILSELKIPGFSQYLHVYGDNLLFGFGRDADHGGTALGLKLSMFDIADKGAVYEKHNVILDYDFAPSSEALYNHKAMLIEPERNIIGFLTEGNRYLVFSYDEEDGFIFEAELKIGRANKHNSVSKARGFYINEYLYIYSPQGIEVFSMNTFELAGYLDFSK